MLDFMDYIQLAFSDASGWNRDNSYTSLTDTAKAILDFTTPERFRVHLSSLSTPQFATSYTIGTVGLIDGSISYLFTTLPLNDTPSRSTLIPLRNLVPGYRQVYRPLPPSSPALADDLESSDSPAGEPLATRPKPSLLHATLHLPPPTTLTALFLHRPSPTSQLSLALWSTQASLASKSGPPQACLLTRLSQDTGKYSSEFLFSTDNSLLGFKGLWNFGPDPRKPKQEQESTPKNDKKCRRHPTSSSVSLLSAGGEAYYSPVSSVVGLSTGLRFTTLPAASAPTPIGTSGQPISTFPYTLTLTLTPLAGALSATYSLLASQNLAFSSRFGFNVYSWESEMVAGCELWRRNQRTPPVDDLDWAKKKMGLSPSSPHPLAHSDPDALDLNATGHETKLLPPELEASSARSTFATSSDSVIKMRVDQSWNLRFLWEGRVKDLLVSAGVALGPSAPTSSSGPSVSPTAGSSPIRGYGWTGVGVSVLYSS